MNDYQRQTLEFRKSIIDNSDKLIAHGHKYQKNKSVGQMSLFGTTDIEITRFDLVQEKLSDYQLEEMASKEVDAIGLPLIYDRYSKFILLEKTLCNASIDDVFYCTEERKQMIFLAAIGDYNHRTSRTGNSYAKVFMVRNGIELKMYLSGDLYRSTVGTLLKNEIYLIKCTYSNNTLSIDKIQLASTIDVSKYIKSITLQIDDLDCIRNIRNFVWLEMRNKGNLRLKYSIRDKIYTMEEDCYSIDTECCLKLINYGAKIFINKEL